jgi:hypothetical protein
MHVGRCLGALGFRTCVEEGLELLVEGLHRMIEEELGHRNSAFSHRRQRR